LTWWPRYSPDTRSTFRHFKFGQIIITLSAKPGAATVHPVKYTNRAAGGDKKKE